MPSGAGERGPSGGSYDDLDRAADEIAGGLLDRGLGERSTLGLVLPSSVD